MKKTAFTIMFVMVLLVASFGIAYADKPVQTDSNGNEMAWENSNSGCATIQDGTILDSAGHPLELGYDQYGYNYQAHIFNGTYDSSNRIIGDDTSDWADDSLIMKWSDEWLANVDCNGDHKLDRGLVDGVVGGISLGWTTNHFIGDYDSDIDGTQDAQYTDFVKIVWTGPGSPLWGQYTIIEEVYNDPTGGYNGLVTKVAAPGLGLNDQWTTTP